MHERRLFIDLQKDASTTGIFKLDAANKKHLIDVLRLKAGDSVIAIDRKSGRAFNCKLTNDHCLVPGSELSNDAQVSPQISLFFALCKSDKNDLVCQKASELGVKRIVLWTAKHSISNLENLSHKQTRWQKIIEEASKQSGRSHLPDLLFANGIEELLKLTFNEPNSVKLCCSLSNRACEFRNLKPSSDFAHLVIGPEGGLSSEEEDIFSQAGFSLLSLGPNRLRSETAAISAVAMLQAIWTSK